MYKAQKMNLECYFLILIFINCYICNVSSINICSNQTEFGRTVYLSHDHGDVTQCQCDISLSQGPESRVGFHKQWFPNKCDFDFFVTGDSMRHNYSCEDFEDIYFNLIPGNGLTIHLEPNLKDDFGFNLAVHSYKANTTLILECYESPKLGETGSDEITTSDTPLSSSPVNNSNGTDHTGLSTGALAGIVIGVIILIILIITIVVCIVRKRMSDEEYDSTTTNDRDLHVYESVTSDTTTPGTYDNADNGLPGLPPRDFRPTICDINSNNRHDYANQNTETVIDSSSPNEDPQRTVSNIQSIIDTPPNMASSATKQDLVSHYDNANVQGKSSTSHADNDDNEK